MKKFELLAASAIALLSATPALAQTDTATPAQAAPDAQGATQASGIEDIVVTAERQSERLQDVPIAVSAFTAKNLEQQQIVNPAALQQSLPNVSFTKTNFTSSSFTIRGIGDLCTGTSCDSATAIHVNDMPLVSTRLFESEFYDLERIEVLRGPQGTLFGRNATSGVVNFITAKPDFSGIHASGEFEYGNYDSKKAKAMFNLPLGNTLGIRVAGLWLNRDGFTHNEYDNSDVDGRKLYSVRGTLSWEPDSDTRLDLIGYYFHERDNRARIQKQLCHRDPTGILGCLPDRLAHDVTNGNSTLASIQSSSEFLSIAASPALAGFGLGSVYGTDFFANATNPTDNRTVNEDFDPTYYAEEQQYQAKFFHSFGNVDFNFTGGYASNKVDSRSDYTMAVESPLTNNPGLVQLQTVANLPGPTFNFLFPNASGGVNPFTGLANVLIPNGAGGNVCQSDASKNDGGVYSGASIGCYPQSLDFDRSNADYRQWSAEGHISSHFDGMFNFLLGGIYLDAKTTDNSYYVNSFGLDYASGLLAAAAAASGAAPPGLVFATPFYNNDEALFRLKSYGIFGETYFDFNDKLKLTLGLRYNHDDKFLSARTTYLVDSAGANPALPYGSTSLSDALNYAGLDYDANKLVWLDPAPANNTWAIAIRKDVADTNKLKSLDDFGKFVTGGGKVKLIASAEFVNSAGALPAFQTTYSFKLSSDQLVVLSGGDTAATIKAAAEQTDGVNTAMVYGTDGGIAAGNLVVLDDDKSVQPVYAPAPVIRESVLKAHPQIADWLKPVFASLDLTTLQELNGRIQVDGEAAKDVAADYLKKKGLVK